MNDSQIGPATPFEQEILAKFNSNWHYLIDRYQEQDQASHHGESHPDFARIQDGIAEVLKTADPAATAVMIQAMIAAVIQTVKDYVPESPGSSG